MPGRSPCPNEGGRSEGREAAGHRRARGPTMLAIYIPDGACNLRRYEYTVDLGVH